LNSLFDTNFIKRYLAAVPFNHYCFHNVTPVYRRIGLSTRQPAAHQGCEGDVDAFVDNYYI
ncbi:hypothetical protein, partial [Yersinia pestis]|uniref:hypothetical protein n=1 Tax=Yersinia pestis TaxID=632 RepID=UPI000576FBC1